MLLSPVVLYNGTNPTAGFESVMSLVAGEWSVWFWLGLVFVGFDPSNGTRARGCFSLSSKLIRRSSARRI